MRVIGKAINGEWFTYSIRDSKTIKKEIDLMKSGLRGALIYTEEDIQNATSMYDDLYFCDSEKDKSNFRSFILSDKEEEIALYESLIKESKQKYGSHTYAYGMISGYPPLVCEWFATKRYSVELGEELLAYRGNTMTFLLPKELADYTKDWMLKTYGKEVNFIIFENRLLPIAEKIK